MTEKITDCIYLYAIFVDYALDFTEIEVYNGDKYEIRNFFSEK